MNLAQLEQRASARRKRSRAKVMPRMREPSDLSYRSDLLDITHDVQAVIRVQLEPWLRMHLDSADSELMALFLRLRIKTSEMVAKRAPVVARRFVRSTAEANRQAMNQQYRSVIKVDPFQSNKGLEEAMLTRAHTNIELIESIPEELLADVEDVVVPRVTAGVRVEEIMQQVQERFGVSDSRAQLIARDQVGKFNGQLARERQEDLGVKTYVWSTSKDSRVRADHAELEGQTFSYDDPPIVDIRTGRRANPGEDYQCRCQPLASVSAVLDALGISDSE